MAGYIGSKVAVVSSGAERKKVFTATSGQTSFTGLSYTVNNVHVFQNGVRLVDGTDYTATNGNSITLTVGAATDDQVVVVSYNTFQTSDTVSASTGGTFAGDVNFTGAFTSRGIDDNATSTAMTLDGSGNLLVGTTDTDPSNDTSGTGGIALGAGSYISLARANSTPLLVNRIGSGTENILFKKDGSTMGSIGVYSSDNLYLQGKSDHSGLAFGEAEIYGFRGGSENDGVTSLGSAAGRFKDLYLSGGVYLGGTWSANKLDDYEEGTWTPTVSVGSITPTNATYVKVGKMVTVQANLADITDRTSTSDVQITGLPFTSSASPQNQSVGSVMFRYLSRSNAVQLTPLLNNNSTTIIFYWSFINGATWDGLRYADATAAPWDLLITMTYEAA